MSQGVTLWEMFTYGKRPYENAAAIDLPDLLERNIRLPQPQICSPHVYTLMNECEWRQFNVSSKRDFMYVLFFI